MLFLIDGRRSNCTPCRFVRHIGGFQVVAAFVDLLLRRVGWMDVGVRNVCGAFDSA